MNNDFSKNKLKIAIVHDWLTVYAGAERVLEQMLSCYPEADLFSTVDFISSDSRGFLKNKTVTTSFIQNLPFAKKFYRSYLPLMPLAVEQFDLSPYDLIISSSHAVSKGVITGPNQLHVCMCYSPIRYAWDLQHQYLKESGLSNGIKAWIAKYMLHKMRIWDLRTANGVDYFIAISSFISQRIKKVYRRGSTVIYPPVDVSGFISSGIKDDFYLTASRMVPYKRMPLIVEAFSKMPDKKLIVIGDGPDYAKCRALATPNIEVMGWQSFDVLRDYMQRAKAFVFAAEEDFGIAPLEAQACGTPVIAYGKGASLETLRGLGVSNPTAVFFDAQSPQAILDAVLIFESESSLILPASCRENALRFSAERFCGEFSAFIESKWSYLQDEQSNPTLNLETQVG
jgi:glycosyltransferase involved in cell wall biosynthesis